MQSQADKCIYTGFFEGIKVYLALYVDDGLLLARDRSVFENLMKAFRESFDITFCTLNTFVGMEISYEENSIFISQTKYIDKILLKFNMNEANTIKTPADPNVKLVSPTSATNSNVPYREVVGSLLFLAMVSRPDIAYAVGVASRYLDNYNETHWRAVKRILRYIKETRSFGLLFQPNDSYVNKLIGFSDADYAADLDMRRSATGYLFVLNNCTVSWSSKRQQTVSLSTTEAEFIAAAEATKEAMWLRKLLSDIGHLYDGPTLLNVDNQSAIKLTRNPEFHRRSKHIDVRYHFICEKLTENVIDTKYVNTENQYADVLTKALTLDKFCRFRNKINVIERAQNIYK